MYSHVHNTYVIKTSISTSCIPQNNMNVLITYIIYMWTHIASSNLNPRRSAHADFCIRENESRMQIWMSHERTSEWFTNECVTICGTRISAHVEMNHECRCESFTTNTWEWLTNECVTIWRDSLMSRSLVCIRVNESRTHMWMTHERMRHDISRDSLICCTFVCICVDESR